MLSTLWPIILDICVWNHGLFLDQNELSIVISLMHFSWDHFLRIFAVNKLLSIERRRPKKGKLGANAMKRVAAGAQLSTPWLFKPAKRSDDRADFCLGTRG